jgi:hypothetical protein
MQHGFHCLGGTRHLHMAEIWDNQCIGAQFMKVDIMTTGELYTPMPKL